MSKDNLKDKLDGNELDLSLSNLTKVPVKELAALPKATIIDLSCNQLQTLPDNIGILSHIVKLDLSKNVLTSLPNGIGNLPKLQHLDLLGNKIRTLPTSVAQLKALRWLDLKENPLEEPLRRVAGDCLNDKECRICATRVLAYMKTKKTEDEKKRQKELQILKEQEAQKEKLRQKNEEKERELKKQQKREEKEMRRRQYEEEQAKKKLEEMELEEDDEEELIQQSNGVGVSEGHHAQSGPTCWVIFFSIIFLLVAVIIGIFFYCDTYASVPQCETFNVYVERCQKYVQEVAKQAGIS
ncbi:leucine-rich repeat-containing protein 59-like [Anneissia japonica]|uniref:leucine-rich repeat-containing protein 59-like n=1 Tax=Anneissia japonica TaxID=1529436 RepID=UPI0014255F3A|nr:leucine-rich repeat-containing protein 59-like [Anneissia japonica]